MTSLTPPLIVASLSCLLSLVWLPPPVTSAPDAEGPHLPAGQVVYLPPRAYLLCWKGFCDPRVWAETAKRTPYYNFGLGKRSVSDHYNYDPDEDEDLGHALEGELDAEDEQDGEPAMEKRSKYGFGIGKRDEDDLRRFNFGLGKREDGRRFAFGLGRRSAQPFNFGLGKREGQRFGFGLGKREVDPSLLEEVRLEGKNGYDEEAPESGGKRAPMYGFGLGKREMYNFGLGKRDKMYSFGLGKRDKMYGFGLGKRGMQYGFGLGKRETSSSDRMYAFGLGKRAGELEAPEGYVPYDVKRAGPYSFGLGKRSGSATLAYLQRLQASGSGTDDNGKRSKFAFGLGKRSAGSSANEGKEGARTTAAPNYNGPHQQP